MRYYFVVADARRTHLFIKLRTNEHCDDGDGNDDDDDDNDDDEEDDDDDDNDDDDDDDVDLDVDGNDDDGGGLCWWMNQWCLRWECCEWPFISVQFRMRSQFVVDVCVYADPWVISVKLIYPTV